MYKRPQRGESEEDLLKLQEEFFKNKAENKIQPAAKFITNTDSCGSSHEEKPIQDNISEQFSNTFETIPSNVTIGEIVENIPKTILQHAARTFPQSKGFPAAKRRGPLKNALKGSIFSQQTKRLKTDEANPASKVELHECDLKKFPSESYVVTGSDKHNIHQENIDTMSKMTEEEIMEEHEQLLSTTDPAIVAFLKSKRHHLSANAEKQTDIEKQNEAAEHVKVEDISTVSDILTTPKAEKWLHFDKLETNKLAWMKDIDGSQLKEKSYEARFDFDGWLLPFKETEINESNRILYHHGEEPDRPGYTLQELFQLCRSNIIQQKITALNSIANILSLESSGIYDDVIDIPIEQVFFVLRFCLDDNTPSVLNAGAKAVRNLFYYLIDETCADNLLAFGLGIRQPGLSSEEKDEEDDETVNDQQLAETNLIKCLIRTDILNRIRYIINTVRPTVETVSYCLELLIRLSRDSLRIAKLVFNCENLLANIIKFFMPQEINKNVPSTSYGVPLKQAIKLLRILATRSKEIASDLVYKYNILNPMRLYLSNEIFSTNTNGIQLQTEVMHCWSVLINYELALDDFRLLEPILLQMLYYHIHNTDLSTSTSYTIQSHAGAILTLIAEVASRKFEYVLPYVRALSEQAITKWSSQFGSLNNFLCGKLVIISATLRCLSVIVTHKAGEFNFVNNCVRNMVNSKGFKIVTSDIKTGSNILSKYDSHRPCKNLVTMEAAVWKTSEHVVPVLQTSSCVPFLCSLSAFVETSDSYKLKLAFLQNDNVQNYLALVKDSSSYNLLSNWFTRVESVLILNLLRISVTVRNDVDTALYFEIAVKCLNIFNSQQKADVEFVLSNIIFNRDFYSHDTLMKNLNVDDQDDSLNASVNNLNQIFETYKEVLGLTTDSSGSFDLCVDIKIGNIIPIDWIYSPIVALYSSMQQNAFNLSEGKLIFIVGNCLRWIYIYETFFAELASLINSADKFCRLACVFLGSDDLFFVPEIHKLLERCLKKLLTNDGRDLDFNRKVHGLNNFQDFYTQLLEQYQGVSYGDSLFSNFILIPLMQKQDVRYRKLLWSEYGGATQICNLTAEDLMCPTDMFLDPPETDLSLLKCYRRAIVKKTLPHKSVLNIIANYHVDHFISNKK